MDSNLVLVLSTCTSHRTDRNNKYLMEKNYVKELYRVFNDLPPYQDAESYTTAKDFTLASYERQVWSFIETPIVVED